MERGKNMKKIFYLIVSLLSIFGIGVKFSYADVSQHASINSIRETTPLYLETASNLHNPTLLADHESHYSHESHASHYSHRSHYSGYQ